MGAEIANFIGWDLGTQPGTLCCYSTGIRPTGWRYLRSKITQRSIALKQIQMEADESFCYNNVPPHFAHVEGSSVDQRVPEHWFELSCLLGREDPLARRSFDL